MGREIRMVPKGWEHPKNDEGRFAPTYNEFFKDAAREWIEELLLWQGVEHPEQIKNPKLIREYPYYWQWAGDPPDKEYYLDEFKSKPICFQIYETVSEGTPVSPVFETEKEMKKHIVEKMGHSEKAADNFIKSKWVPSMVLSPGKGLLTNIDIAENMK